MDLKVKYPPAKIYWSGNRNKKLKEFLFKKHPYCYWCKRKLIIHVHEDHKATPPNAATIDHLVSRFIRKKGEVVDKVLACNECNEKRAHEEELIYKGNSPKPQGVEGN